MNIYRKQMQIKFIYFYFNVINIGSLNIETSSVYNCFKNPILEKKRPKNSARQSLFIRSLILYSFWKENEQGRRFSY